MSAKESAKGSAKESVRERDWERARESERERARACARERGRECETERVAGMINCPWLCYQHRQGVKVTCSFVRQVVYQLPSTYTTVSK